MYNLKLSKEQLRVISNALNTWSRLHAGQFSQIIVDLNKMGKVDYLDFSKQIKKQLFPELKENESYGIRSKEISDSSRVAYDIHQVLRHALALERQELAPEGTPEPHTVDFNPPYQTSEHVKLAEVEVLEKKYKIVSNKIQCKECHDIIESKYRHDFVWCSCKACFVDGGHDYLSRGGSNYKELSESEEVE